MVPVSDLVLLGLLMEGPLHGYEIRQTLEERMVHVARIPPGTIYYTLKKLEQQGLVEMSTERAGNRPERQVYRITETGRARFHELAQAALTLDERAFWTFDAALFFLPLLENARVVDAVAEKRKRLAAFRRDVDALSASFPGRWPLHLMALRRKGEILGDALGAWYDELDALLRARPSSTTKPPLAAAVKSPRPRATTARDTRRTQAPRATAKKRPVSSKKRPRTRPS
jgi:DNA-binding PadR family transcriptional regulator